MTLDELERAAYQAGDLERADLLARLIDAENFELERDSLSEERDRLFNVVEDIKARIMETNWRTEKKAELQQLVGDILEELEEVK